MGQTNGGGSGSFRQEHVESASRVSRPMNGLNGKLRHEGVVVNTREGNSYLIHHPGPGHVTTVTSASNMSNRWKTDHEIKVNGNPTVQQVYNGAGGRSNNTAVNYVTAGLCKGAAYGAEKVLTKK